MYEYREGQGVEVYTANGWISDVVDMKSQSYIQSENPHADICGCKICYRWSEKEIRPLWKVGDRVEWEHSDKKYRGKIRYIHTEGSAKGAISVGEDRQSEKHGWLFSKDMVHELKWINQEDELMCQYPEALKSIRATLDDKKKLHEAHKASESKYHGYALTVEKEMADLHVAIVLLAKENTDD